MADNKIINPLKAKWQTPFHRARAAYEEYPRQFWILMLGTFIDRTGGAALFPFFTLYVTRKFGVGMTEVGAAFGIFAVSSFIGSTIGGALTDRWERKSIILFGLVMSATTSILMGVIENCPCSSLSLCWSARFRMLPCLPSKLWSLIFCQTSNAHRALASGEWSRILRLPLDRLLAVFSPQNPICFFLLPMLLPAS